MAICPAADLAQEFSATEVDLAGVATSAIAASLLEGETAQNGDCVHKHSGRLSEGRFLLLAGNTASEAGAGFIFPDLLEKLTQAQHKGLYTQSYFEWGDRTPEEVDLTTFRVDAWYYTEGWSEKRLRTVLASINKMVYHWGICTGAIVEEDADRPGGGSVRRACKAIARTAIYSRSVLLCALSSINGYIREFWGHAFGDRSLWGWLDELRQDGFLDYASENRNGKKSRQWLLNIPDLLLLAEACEKRILEKKRMEETEADPYGFEWEAMPAHHGYTLKILFDAVFPGWGWNRTGDDTQNEPTSYAETDECQQDAPDEHWDSIEGIRGMVARLGGWTSEVADCCDRLAAVWGAKWGVEAVYERIALRRR